MINQSLFPKHSFTEYQTQTQLLLSSNQCVILSRINTFTPIKWIMEIMIECVQKILNKKLRNILYFTSSTQLCNIRGKQQGAGIKSSTACPRFIREQIKWKALYLNSFKQCKWKWYRYYSPMYMYMNINVPWYIFQNYRKFWSTHGIHRIHFK